MMFKSVQSKAQMLHTDWRSRAVNEDNRAKSFVSLFSRPVTQFSQFSQTSPGKQRILRKLFASPPPFVFIFPWRHINVRGSML